MNTQQPLTVSEAGLPPFLRINTKLNALVIANKGYIEAGVASDALAYDSEQPERFFHDLGVTRGRKTLNSKLFKTLLAFKDPEAFYKSYESDTAFEEAIKHYHPNKDVSKYEAYDPFAVKLAYRYTATNIANQLGLINPPLKQGTYTTIYTKPIDVATVQLEKLRDAYERADAHIRILNDIIAKQPHTAKAFFAKKILEYDPKYPGLFFLDCDDTADFYDQHMSMFYDRHGAFCETYLEEIKELFPKYKGYSSLFDGYDELEARDVDGALGHVISIVGAGILDELVYELDLNASPLRLP